MVVWNTIVSLLTYGMAADTQNNWKSVVVYEGVKVCRIV
jgi:hypothetical protein